MASSRLELETEQFLRRNNLVLHATWLGNDTCPLWCDAHEAEPGEELPHFHGFHYEVSIMRRSHSGLALVFDTWDTTLNKKNDRRLSNAATLQVIRACHPFPLELDVVLENLASYWNVEDDDLLMQGALRLLDFNKKCQDFFTSAEIFELDRLPFTSKLVDTE